jgi:hypothetical protein
MEEQSGFTSKEDIFLQYALGDLKEPEIGTEEDLPFSVELLKDRYDYVPKISLYDSVDGWIELREQSNRFVLKCIGSTAVGLVCEQIDHKTGITSLKLIEGSVFNDDVDDIDGSVTSALEGFFFDQSIETDPFVIGVQKEDEVENYLLSRYNILRDSFLLSHDIYTEADIENISVKESLRNFGRFAIFSLDTEYWDGREDVLYLDTSATWAHHIQRGRLITVEGQTKEVFGRTDALPWSVDA